MAILLPLLISCNLTLKLNEPYLQVATEAAYADSGNIIVSFKFSADEPILRCRYLVTRDDREVIDKATGPLAPEIWHEQRIEFPDSPENGEYRLRINIQAERSGEFSNLAFLDESRSFYFDNQPPVESPFPDPTNSATFSNGYLHVFLTHPELTSPQASPTTIRYTLNGDDPIASSARYEPSIGIVRPVADYHLTLKAAAIDLAGNRSPIYSPGPLFLDTGPPAAPSVDLSDSQRFNSEQAILITQSELANPQGSPVAVYYTLDGADPRISPNRSAVDGNPIQLPFSSSPVRLRAIALDAAGNSSAEELARNYRFMSIGSVVPVDPDPIDKSPRKLEVTGFGFDLITQYDVTMYDSSSQPITLYFSTQPEITSTSIKFIADLNPSTASGLATVFVVVNDPANVAVSGKILVP